MMMVDVYFYTHINTHGHIFSVCKLYVFLEELQKKNEKEKCKKKKIENNFKNEKKRRTTNKKEKLL